MNVERWAKQLRARIERERVEFLVEWARKNGGKSLQNLYEKAQTEFHMAGEQKARKYAEAALRKIDKIRTTHTQN